jgi:LysM repeat protein
VTAQLAGVPRPSGRLSHYLAPVVLLLLLVAVAAVVVTNPGHGSSIRAASASHAAARRLPPYWFVRSGDTLSQVSASTGLSIDQLEAVNPGLDPEALVTGERLNLWRHPPVPKPPPPGPMFWTVRPGQSFGSIAAQTNINIVTLEQLNPKLKPASLQPGERVRLRR